MRHSELRALCGVVYAESVFDALQDIFEMRFRNSIEDFASVFLAIQESAPLHQPQVFGSHGTG